SLVSEALRRANNGKTSILAFVGRMRRSWNSAVPPMGHWPVSIQSPYGATRWWWISHSYQMQAQERGVHAFLRAPRLAQERRSAENAADAQQPGGRAMFRKSLLHCAVISLISLACNGFAVGQAAADDHKAQIDALRKSLEKYQDYKVAVRDLYL